MRQIPSSCRHPQPRQPRTSGRPEGPGFFTTLIFSVFALLLGGLGAAQAQIFPEEAGLVVCESNVIERSEALTPDQVADIEGIAATLRTVYGEKVGEVQDFLEDDFDLAATLCEALRADIQVIADIEGFHLLDGDEVPLGNWRPHLLQFEVALEDLALTCQFVDSGLVGTKVLYQPFGMGLFVSGEEQSYLANFGDRQIWVAIDPDGRRLGFPAGDPFGDNGGDGKNGPKPTESNCETWRSALWSQCWDNPDPKAEDPTRGECQICCTDVYSECYRNNDLPNGGYTQDNYFDCAGKCDELPTNRALTIQSP